MRRSAIRRSAQLMRLVIDHPGGGATELSRRANLPYATTHRILAVLCDEYVVRRDAERRYWAQLSPDGRNVNWTTPDALADLGGQSTFHSNLVAIVPVEGDGPG